MMCLCVLFGSTWILLRGCPAWMDTTSRTKEHLHPVQLHCSHHSPPLGDRTMGVHCCEFCSVSLLVPPLPSSYVLTMWSSPLVCVCSHVHVCVFVCVYSPLAQACWTSMC